MAEHPSGPYPVRLEVDYAERHSRWVVFEWLFIIPHFFILPFFWLASICAALLAFVVVLVTGHHPRPLFDFQVGVQSWTVRVCSSAALLCNRFPPFSLSPRPRSTGRFTIGFSGLAGLGATAIVSVVLIGIVAFLRLTRDWNDVSLQSCAPFGSAGPAEVYAGYAFGTIRLNQGDPAPSAETYVVTVSQSQGPQDLDTSDFELLTTAGSTLGPFAAFIGGDDSVPATTLNAPTPHLPRSLP